MSSNARKLEIAKELQSLTISYAVSGLVERGCSEVAYSTIREKDVERFKKLLDEYFQPTTELYYDGYNPVGGDKVEMIHTELD